MTKKKQKKHIAEKLTDLSGTMAFLVINLCVFTVWIAGNALGILRFDVFPFNFLTLSVSLEAIFLAILVLITQNRQQVYAQKLAEDDAKVNIKAKEEIETILKHLDEQDNEMLVAINTLSQALKETKKEIEIEHDDLERKVH